MYSFVHLNVLNTTAIEHVRAMFQSRFDICYWSSIDAALLAQGAHSIVCIAMESGDIAGCTLVSPPTAASRQAYARSENFPPLEIAFVATSLNHEGRGLARRMLSEVLLSCTTTQQGCWLHVDLDNVRAHTLYTSLGFKSDYVMPDPYGSIGTLMTWWPRREHTRGKIGSTLLDARPCEAEKPLRRGVFAPPGVTCS